MHPHRAGPARADQHAATSCRSRRTSSSSGSGPRSTCSDRCSPAAGTSGCRCPAATTSAPARSTCTSRASRRWAPRSSSATATSRRRRPAARRRHHASSSRASGRPRTCSRPPCCAKGTTVIDNAAREPEIADLCEFLVAMGANIDGHRHVDARDRRRRAGLAARRSDHTVVPTASRPPRTSPPSPWPAAS